MLQVKSCTIGYGAKTVIPDFSITFETGSFTAIVGRNGSGKSTLMRAMARSLRPVRGDILLDDVSIYRQSTKKLARRMAVLAQGVRAPEDYTVHRLVCNGRYPYAGFGGRLTGEDLKAVDMAMEEAGIASFRNRPLQTLSGGELQRAWLALTLAQQPGIMLLDEPTTFLDIGCQMEILDLVRSLNRTKGITVIAVLHDLNHAAAYADRMVALRDGRVYADGQPGSVLTVPLLEEVFQTRARVLVDEESGRPYCLPVFGW